MLSFYFKKLFCFHKKKNMYILTILPTEYIDFWNVAAVWWRGFFQMILPMEWPRDSNRDLHTVMWHNHRRVYQQYFTESCKKITAFCHNHRRIYWRNVSHRYFTEICKKITVFYHNHRQPYRWHLSRQYFNKSCKQITDHATIINAFPDEITDG